MWGSDSVMITGLKLQKWIIGHDNVSCIYEEAEHKMGYGPEKEFWVVPRRKKSIMSKSDLQSWRLSENKNLGMFLLRVLVMLLDKEPTFSVS